ncbi:hypothetical protein ACHAXA_007567 [Cyclostephanos tholiformis]|uniref:Uncharacterized protein n=1 Tax=Cyclostephanos tholiformis TaxID=382380 RepID=A0ABD3SR29_9STRA
MAEFFPSKFPVFCPARDFQIDFITAQAGQFEIRHFFLSWGDCGRVVGQIAGAVGLRFGQQDLFLRYFDRPGVSDNLILSELPEQICEFLGLDCQKRKNDFCEKRTIFRWLWESAYIHGVDLQCLRQLRRADRGMYIRFAEYSNEEHPLPACPVAAPSLDTIVAYFGKQMEFEAIKRKQAHGVICRDKFGARQFSVLGDLSGKELGRIIEDFKRTVPGNFKERVGATENEDIQLTVTEYLYTARLIGVGIIT